MKISLCLSEEEFHLFAEDDCVDVWTFSPINLSATQTRPPDSLQDHHFATPTLQNTASSTLLNSNSFSHSALHSLLESKSLVTVSASRAWSFALKTLTLSVLGSLSPRNTGYSVLIS